MKEKQKMWAVNWNDDPTLQFIRVSCVKASVSFNNAYHSKIPIDDTLSMVPHYLSQILHFLFFDLPSFISSFYFGQIILKNSEMYYPIRAYALFSMQILNINELICGEWDFAIYYN